MPATLDLSGLDRLQARFQRIANPNATPLMHTWELIMQEDNRKGVMAGLDHQGIPMIPVTYRPKPATEKQRKAIARSKLPKNFKQRIGLFQGGVGGNLTSAEYRLLTGPPLAPRGQFSRVITNFKTDFTGPPEGFPVWQAIGFWDDVVNTKGRDFLRYHFHAVGVTRLPRRDLRGIRPEGVQKARQAMLNWAMDAIRRAN